MDKKRAIEIALLYIPTMLGDEADLGITYEDLEEVPNVLKEMLNSYEQVRADAIDEFAKVLINSFCWSLSKYSSDKIISQIIKNCAEQLKDREE